MCLFVLIDSRHKPQEIDQEFMQWLAEKKIPFVMIFTKADKLGKINLNKNLELYKKSMLKEWQEMPEHFITSAKKKEGLNKIIDYMIQTNYLF